MKSAVALLLSCCLLSGCASGPVDVPLSVLAPQEDAPQVSRIRATGTTTVDSSGNITDIGPNTSATLVHFSDSRVASEAIIASSLKHRDTQIRLAHAQSGTIVEFELVEVSPGLKVQMIKKLTSRETANFSQPLPTKPSDHPGWETAKSIVHDGFIFGMVWKGLDTVSGMFKNLAAAKTGDVTYNGPVIKSQSDNTSGGGAQTFDGSAGAYKINSDNPEVPAVEPTTTVVTP